MISGSVGFHVVKNSLGHGRVELLGSQPIAAIEQFRGLTFFHVRGANIQVKRLTQGPRLFGAVENRQCFG